MRNYRVVEHPNTLYLSRADIESRQLNVFQTAILRGMGPLEIIVDHFDPGPDGEVPEQYCLTDCRRVA
jgi:hypothetical protein